MAVDDHGIETLKKSAEEMVSGSMADYYHKVGLVIAGSPAQEVSGSNPLPVTGIVATPVLNSVTLSRHDYSGVSVTTLAYTTLIASTSGNISDLYIFDSSGQTLVLATGAAGFEIDQYYIVPGGDGLVKLTIPAGSRISIKAISGTASVGELSITFLLNSAAASKTSVDLLRNDYSSVNVTTGAYVELISATSDDVNQLYIFDSSGQTLYIAVGAAASEVNQYYVVPGGNGLIELFIPSGSRVSLKAVSGNATVGEFSATLIK